MAEPALDTRSDQYRPRSPQTSQYYQCIEDHFDAFEQVCDERFARQYGFLRAYVKDVVYRYLDCGILHNGFARVRCGDCGHEYLLAFSCKCRHFCPSCHQKRVVEFGEYLCCEVLKKVPHRHFVFSIPNQAKKGKKTKTFEALEWLAAMCSHVPNRGEQMVRYYGYYSNVSRGRRKKENRDEILPHIIEDHITSPARRKAWARLIQKIYEVDPLTCPKCSGSMKIIAFIEQPEIIKKILQHVGLWEVDKRPPPRAGPSPEEIHIDYSESQIVYSGDEIDPNYPFDAYH